MQIYKQVNLVKMTSVTIIRQNNFSINHSVLHEAENIILCATGSNELIILTKCNCAIIKDKAKFLFPSRRKGEAGNKNKTSLFEGSATLATPSYSGPPRPRWGRNP